MRQVVVRDANFQLEIYGLEFSCCLFDPWVSSLKVPCFRSQGGMGEYMTTNSDGYLCANVTVSARQCIIGTSKNYIYNKNTHFCAYIYVLSD